MHKFMILILGIIILLFIGPVMAMLLGKVDFRDDYMNADRSSANIAPNPQDHKEAIIQVYSARAFNWRGAFGVHMWISIKAENADNYVVYQVLGWRAYQGLSVVDIREDIPDRNWFNQKPKIILDIRGDKAQKLIAQIDNAAKSYPYFREYGLWPGPNSNSFIAYIARKVPDFALALPSNALGKDFIGQNKFFAVAPSNSGYQFSLFGLFGILIAKKEGIEINLLGLVYGIKFKPFHILFPGFD